MYLWTDYNRLYELFFPGTILALARADDDIDKFGDTGNPTSLLSKVVQQEFNVVGGCQA
jgi:hypothetical protein